MPETSVLKIENVNKSYKVKKGLNNSSMKRVLENIDLSLYKGEILGLVGESGCGKTTLGKCITGLIADYTGNIIYNNQVLSYKTEKERQNNTLQIQMVFQDPFSSLNPKKKIGWILEEPLHARRFGTSESRKECVCKTLELVGLSKDLLTRYPRELSGGQRQRVSIGTALILEPSIIIADEPVSALDVSVQSQILNLFKELNQKLGISIIFISHNLNVVYYLCDRIAVMDKGKIIECETADKVYYEPKEEYTRHLLNSILI
ncbi:MAG: ATP-binding cassette domain-containing protein [Anaerocolumna sp.]